MPLSHRFGCQALEELNTTDFGSFTIILDSFGDWNILEYIGISKRSLTLIQFMRGNWTAMLCIGMDMDVYSTHHKVGWNWHWLVARMVHRDWNHLVVFEVSTSGCLPLEIARLRWLDAKTSTGFVSLGTAAEERRCDSTNEGQRIALDLCQRGWLLDGKKWS